MKKLYLIAASMVLLAGQSVMSAELTILTENLPPLNYVDNGTLVGPSVEIVREIQKRVGSQEQIQVYPWARAYKMALKDENVILFGMTYTKVRKDKFKWVGKSIGTLIDDTRGRLLERNGFSNLEPVSDEQLNAKKLAIGRIDLWAYKIPGLRTVCDLAGVDYTKFEEVYHLREIDLMIAFSKKTSDSIVQKWRDAFNEMLADGAIMKIRKKWNMKLEDDPFPEIKD
jgi:polar amino acid transport system substrate-binding protein